MLKTNSKQATENFRAYIIKHFNFESYDDGRTSNSKSFGDIAIFIYKTFQKEYLNGRRYNNRQDEFEQWCEGLPSVLDTCYYYNRSAVDDLAQILAETETEKTKYSEAQAQKILSRKIYMLISGEYEKSQGGAQKCL